MSQIARWSVVLAGTTLGFVLACDSAPAGVRGEFVVLSGRDTVIVERFSEDTNVVRIDIARGDNERDEVTAWLRVDREVDSLDYTIVSDGERSAHRAVFTDTTVLRRTERAGKTEELSTPTTSRRMPFYHRSLALTQLLVRRLHLAAGRDSNVLVAVRARSVQTYALSRTGDTVLLADPRRMLSLALDDRDDIVGGRTRDGYRIVRRVLGDTITRLGSNRAGWLHWIPPDIRQIGKCQVSDYPISLLSVIVDDSLDGAATHLRSDGRGPYTNEIDGVGAVLAPFMEIKVPRDPYTQPQPKTNRALSIDLSHPVPGTGAVPMGVIGEGFASVTAFYRKDRVTDSIFNPLDMKVGEQVESARVELVFSGGEVGHNLSALSFGSFPRGYCEGARTSQDLTGTTQPIITRVSPTTWSVLIPRGSIGRLWSNAEGEDATAGTHNRGLYYSSGRFEFTLIPRP